MTKTPPIVLFTTLILLFGASSYVYAQQLPIPQLQACNNQLVQGKATGTIASRRGRDPNHTGEFTVTVEVKCRKGKIQDSPYHLEIDAFTLSDTEVKNRIAVDRFDQLTSVGAATTPTIFLNGTCKVMREDVPGCRFWLMLVDNGQNNTEAPDIIGFLVIDGTGKRITYGTGTVTGGDIRIVEDE